MTVSVNGPAPVYARPVVSSYGPQGPTGPAGGPTGNTGNSGPTGAGAVGPQGPTGQQGLQGFTGNTGPTGFSGPAGVTGSPGAATNTGATGPSGPTGFTGAGGAASNTGATGFTGPTGSTGYGATGPTAGQVAVNYFFGSNAPQGQTATNGDAGLPLATGFGAGRLAASITPAVSGDVMFRIDGSIYNITLGSPVALGVVYGTGIAPAFQTAVPWNVVGGTGAYNGSNAQYGGFSAGGIASGLIAGTKYWFDLITYPIGSGTVELLTCNLTAYELGGGQYGPTGYTGNTGPTGPSGPTGLQGSATNTGATGPTFTATGNTGPQGASGPINLNVNTLSTAYTAVLADGGGVLYHSGNDGSARTFTIPANAAVAYPVGTTLTFVNFGGALTIAINSDTLAWAAANLTGTRTLTSYGIATALKFDATLWVISGAGLS